MKLKIITTFVFAIILIGCTTTDKPKISGETPHPNIDTFYCSIKSIEIKSDYYDVKLDRIDFLFSDAAQKAMVEDGLLGKDEWPLNDYYLRNKEIIIENFKFDNSVQIIMQTYSHDDEGEFNWNQTISIADFLKVFDRTDGVNYINHPFNIITNGNKILVITERFIP